MRAEIVEVDFQLAGGGSSEETDVLVPAQASVWGVTGRVLQPITGTLTDWSLGVVAEPSRYGTGLGLGAGSWLRGITGQPVTYYAATRLQLTANGGDFTGGEVRLAIHMMRFELPDGN